MKKNQSLAFGISEEARLVGQVYIHIYLMSMYTRAPCSPRQWTAHSKLLLLKVLERMSQSQNNTTPKRWSLRDAVKYLQPP